MIFDLDGTLVDSAPTITGALNRLLRQEGRPPVALDTVKQLVGDGAPRLVERALAATGPAVEGPALTPLVERYVAMMAADPPGPDALYPGVAETLERLAAAGLALGLCSNKPAAAIRSTLSSLGIAERFGAVIGGDSLPQRKPSGEPLLAAIAGLGAVPERAVMVGDNANDVRTARAAGLPVIAVSYGYPRMPVAELGADLVIDRFADLPAALHRLGEHRTAAGGP